MSMADRIAVMNAGRVEQFDTPERSTTAPPLFVATFVGTANLLPGRLARRRAAGLVDRRGRRLALSRGRAVLARGRRLLAARPEHLAIGCPQAGRAAGHGGMVLPLGPSLVYELDARRRPPIKVTLPRTDLSASRSARRPASRCGRLAAAGRAVAVFAG
jgi:putative spermidine/putrescine transport system ATP-binding protein